MTPSSAEGGFVFSDPQGNVGQVVLATGTASVQATPSRPGTILYSAAFDPTSGFKKSSDSLNVPVRVAASDASCGLGTAVYVLSSGSQTVTSGAYGPSASYQSGACAQGAGTKLTLVTPEISKTGDGVVVDDPSGINSAVLAYGPGSSVSIQSGLIQSTGIGAYGAFASGVGATVDVNGTVIEGEDGIGAASGGAVTLTNAHVSANFNLLVSVNGGSSVTATDSTLASLTGGAVAQGAITFYDNRLPGDPVGTGHFAMTGGTLDSGQGTLVTVYANASADVSLTRVMVNSGPVLCYSFSPGSTTITVSASAIHGDIQLQNDGVAPSLTLKDSSTYQGRINGGALTLDASSKWTLPDGAGSTMIGKLTDADAISGDSVTNIVGNGSDVLYDPAVNPSLGGKSYGLVGGGHLKPKS